MIPTSVGVDVLVSLADRLTAPLRNAEDTVAKASERMQKRLALSMKLAGGGAAAAGIAYGAQRLVTGFTDSIRDVERAKGELATLGVRDLDAVVRRGQEMQMQLAGVTADAFVRASYDIKSGISSLTDQGVADMTASAMLVAKATKGQAEQMTSLFATSYGIFKKQMEDLTDAEFGEQFGAALSASVQQFKTDGAAMQQAIESAGAGAVNLGMDMTEQLTLLGMMQQQMQAGEAGTALRAFATNAAKAHEAFGKMQVSADRPVRVRILDENGGLRDMPDILADLQARYGETLDAFEAAEIKEAFGTDEAMKMINALYGQEAAVRANADALGDAAQQGSEFTSAMAAAADNNWDATMVLMSQKMDVISQKIGERLLPVVQRLVPYIDAFIATAFDWIDANPELITGIGAVVVGLGALAAVIAPILIGAGALVSGWAMMSFGATKLVLSLAGMAKWVLGAVKGLLWLGRTVLPLVGKAVLFLGRALIANPIGLIIAAIAGAAYLIYQNWEPIAGFFADVWGRVTDAVSSAWSYMQGLFDRYNPRDIITNAWQGVAGFFGRLWDRIKGGVSAGWELIKSTFLNYHPVGLILSNWDGISETFAGYWESIKTGVSTGWEAIKALFLDYHPLGLIISNWSTIADTFAGYWTSIKDGVATGWDAIKTKLGEFGPAALIEATWAGVADWFGSLWERVKTKFTDITWADVLPDWDWGFISDFDLTDVIKWPEPPDWWKRLMGQEVVDVAPPKASESAGFDALPYHQQDVARVVENVVASGPLPTPAHIEELELGIADINAQIAEAQAGIANLGEGPMTAAMAMPYQDQIRALTADLEVAEAELKDARARSDELGQALQVLSETEATPEINTASVDAALAKVARLSASLRNLPGGAPATNSSGSPVQARAKGGAFRPGWLLTGEEGPELEYRTEGGFIAHNRALRNMLDMATRTRDLVSGIGFDGVAGASMPAMATVAAAGGSAMQRGPITFSPQYNMPLAFEGGVDLDEVRATVRAELSDAEDRARVELRGLLHD
ncbi:phage tail tape measure protein [Sulfitobacter delicatus]|uniref:Phage tail tape measure protein, TP901 family, core region n=1 Tax=Sulfitobacter delicatus TaxID=218672 RepID=A0A1G7SBE8_9RHOB|nr:phage tail tape measure protein [Sulfitobacter delicatus]SDG19510.1 phage tail tape measure protein, TP901 family, core region [Sulfitobacter delicatus]